MRVKGLMLMACFGTSMLWGQPLLEDFSAGLNGRTEQNFYGYYGGKGIGNYNTYRVSNGYSTGVFVHSSVNYLFNAGLGLNLAEARYKPDLERNGSVLYSSYLRLWQFDFWGELKFSNNEKHRPFLLFGGQVMTVQYKNETYSKPGDAEIYTWPTSRFMPRLGVGYYFELGKKLQFSPSFGMRLALNNKVGYDFLFNQFYAGLNVAWKLKSW